MPLLLEYKTKEEVESKKMVRKALEESVGKSRKGTDEGLGVVEVEDTKKVRPLKRGKASREGKDKGKDKDKVLLNSSRSQESGGGGEDENCIEIRKYSNRRLYCTTLSEYIVHDDVAEMIRQGKDVVVREAKTGEDITRTVLTQIILDAEGKDENSLLPLSFLRSLISLYGNGVNHFLLPRFLEQSIRTFEDSTRGFEHYLDSLFDDMPDNFLSHSLMNPLKDVGNMNRKVYEMNKEMMRNSMRMMMGEGWSSMKGFDKAISNEEREKIAVSQQRLHKRLLGRRD